jgi:propanol-preferring alcohol dehydrogenase
MLGWQFTTTHEPLRLVEVPDPEPGPGEVVLDIHAAGLCHSDVGALTDESWLRVIRQRPVIMGHEIAGVVAAVGPDVTEVAVGDRVGVCPSNGHGAPGYARDGGFTTRHRVLADDLVPMPDDLSFELAALGTDAGMTSYHAMVARGGCTAGMRVGVIGLGGLGQIGARVAVVLGAEVHVAEVNEEVWPMAREIGAASIVADVSEWAGMDLDLVVDYAGYGTTTAGALNAIRKQGSIVLVGMARMQITLETYDIIRTEVHLLGSNGGTKEDVAAVYELLASGQVDPKVTVIGFDDIPAGLDDLQHHRITGRLVARIVK